MKRNKFTFKDWVSIVIALVADLLFAGAFVFCYVGMFLNYPCLFAFVGAFFASIIPGLLVYGITAALIDLIRGK